MAELRIPFTIIVRYDCIFDTEESAMEFEVWLSENAATSKGVTDITRSDNTVTVVVPKDAQSYDPTTVLNTESRF